MYDYFYVIGDTHGVEILKQHFIKNDIQSCVLFHVGDFGVGFKDREKENKILYDFNTLLNDKNNHLYVIRGNHDNPQFFNGDYNLSNLHLVPDYSVIDFKDKKILMVGGSISIDRIYRLEMMEKFLQNGIYGETYWEDEGFVFDKDIIKNLDSIDYVITHDSPNFIYPYNDFSNINNSHGDLVEYYVKTFNDSNLKKDINENRLLITNMYNSLIKKNNIKKWFIGHYHKHLVETHLDTEFIFLDINQFYRNIL